MENNSLTFNGQPISSQAMNQPAAAPTLSIFKKLLVGVLLLISYAAVAAGFYYLGINQSLETNDVLLVEPTPLLQDDVEATNSQVNSQTEELVGWLTYDNDQYQFSFQYPPDWQVTNLLPNNMSYFWEDNFQLLSLGLAPKEMVGDNISYVSIVPSYIDQEIQKYIHNVSINSDGKNIAQEMGTTRVGRYDAKVVQELNTINNVKVTVWFIAYQGNTLIMSASSSQSPGVAQVANSLVLKEQDQGNDSRFNTTPISQETAQEAAVVDLAQRLGIAEGQVEVLENKVVNWSDGCVGCHFPDYVCTTAITKGLYIRLQVDDQIYYYHSAENRLPRMCEAKYSSLPPLWDPDDDI